MAGPTNTEKIATLDRAIAVHDERINNTRENVREIVLNAAEVARSVQEIDKRLVVVARDVERLEKRLDDLLTRRWELWKLILAAFLGGLLTVAAGFVSRAFDRLISPVPASSTSGQRP